MQRRGEVFPVKGRILEGGREDGVRSVHRLLSNPSIWGERCLVGSMTLRRIGRLGDKAEEGFDPLKVVAVIKSF